MGIDLSFLHPQNQANAPDLSFLDSQPKEEPGVFSYIGNLAKNTLATIAVADNNSIIGKAIIPVANYLYGNSPEDRVQLRQIKANLEAADLHRSEAAAKVNEDLTPSKFFSKISDWAGNIGSPSDMISGLPMALASTVGSPLEASTGLALGKEGAPVLTPEERAGKMKETAGIIISSTIAGVTKVALTGVMEKAALGGAATLGQETNLGLNILSKGPKIGQFGRDLIKGGVEASAAGATFGAVANANNENQLGGILAGLMFAPLGMAGEILGTKIHGGDNISKIQKSAGDLFALRQLQYSPDKSLFTIEKGIENLATSDNLATAVAKGQLEAGTGHIIVPNVSGDVATSIQTEFKDYFHKMFEYKNPDGTSNILFADDARMEGTNFNSNDAAIFKATGYLPNEVVSWKGKDYLIDDYRPKSSDLTALKDPTTQQRILAPFNEITKNTAFDLDNGQVLINSPVTLKGKLLAAFRNQPKLWDLPQYDLPNPFLAENNAALYSVKTGEPITFIGMRQERGQGIIGNGKFYALDPNLLTTYPGKQYQGFSADVVKSKKELGVSQQLGSMGSAMGRESVFGIIDQNLRVNRLAFDNPFVFNGKHYSLMKDVENFYNKYVGSSKLSGIQDWKGATSNAGIQWGNVFTEQEMKGIIAAKDISNKPVGIPTSKYLQERAGIDIDAPDQYGMGAGKTHMESHYALVDRIVARAMRRNGYDGFVYKGGRLANTEVVDISERGSWNRADQTTTIEGRASNILTGQRFVDKLYDEFKTSDVSSETQQVEKGVKNTTNTVIPNGTSWEDRFNNFTKNKGILPEELPNLRRAFESKIHGEILDNLPPEEKSLYTRLQNEITDKNEEQFNDASDKLKSSALQNNMYFNQADAGVINLRDMESNKSLGTFHSIQDAQDFITKSGQTSGTSLDGNSIIPTNPSGAGKFLPDNIGPQPRPPIGWLERKYALVTTAFPWTTANATLFKNFDTTFGSRLHDLVFNKVDKAAQLATGRKQPFINRLRSYNDLLQGMNKQDRENIFNWMETRSINEHVTNGGPGLRQMSPMEVALGKQLVPADLDNMWKFYNAMRSVDANDVKTTNALRQQYNIGPKEDNALALLDMARKQSTQQVSIGTAVHYARLQQNPELALTRNEYAKKFNLSQKQLTVGASLDKYFGDLSDLAGVPKDKLLFNYMTHARLYDNGSLDAAIGQFALQKPMQDFYASLNRTGELSSIERDPIKAALRYTNAVFNHLYVNPALDIARDNLKMELGQIENPLTNSKDTKIPSGAQAQVLNVANKYFADVGHFPAASDKYIDTAVNHFNKTVLGNQLSDFHINKWANAMNQVVTLAAQGLRPWSVMRDFYSNNSKYFIKWGLQDSLGMLKAGAEADLPRLRQSGVIETYSNFGVQSSVDEAANALTHAGSRLSRVMGQATQVAMKGEQYVNDMARAGAFQWTWSKVASMSRDLLDKKFGDDLASPTTYQKAYATLQLERYSPAVQDTFDRMIKNSKFDEAAAYLGNQNIQETFGNYINGNNPSGWNNVVGRLVGKFGRWGINHRDYVVSLASRGTRAQRLASLGRLAITEGSVAALASTLGVNLSHLYQLPGVYFKGGPVSDLFYTAYSAMFNQGADQETALKKIQRLLPFDDKGFHGSIVVPFSFTFTDLVDGLEQASNGDVAGGLARVGGIRPQSQNYQPSKWEKAIGNIVGGSGLTSDEQNWINR